MYLYVGSFCVGFFLNIGFIMAGCVIFGGDSCLNASVLIIFILLGGCLLYGCCHLAGCSLFDPFFSFIGGFAALGWHNVGPEQPVLFHEPSCEEAARLEAG